MFVGLVCPPTSPRPLDDAPLPTSATEPMLQRVIERCIVILNSAPTGTPEQPNAVLSSAHQALQSILSAPSSTMNNFVDKYLTHLICGVAVSVGSMATALGDVQFVADAMTTADVLLRRAGHSHTCSDLEKIHQVITDVDVPSMLASVVIATTCGVKNSQKKKGMSKHDGEKEKDEKDEEDEEDGPDSQRNTILSTMSNFYGSNDIGQRRTSIATVAALILCMEDVGENPKVMTELLLSKAMDQDNGVVRHAVRGLGNVVIAWTSRTFEEHATNILNTCVGLMDKRDDNFVADSSLSSLVHILTHARRGIVQPLLLNICFRLHSAISGGNTVVHSTLVCCFSLLSNIAKFGVDHVDGKDMKSQLEEQLHRMLPLVVVQLRSSSFDVSIFFFFSLPLSH